MSIDADKYEVYAAIAGAGDFDAGVEALHRLPPDASGRSALAVKMIALCIAPTQDLAGGLRDLSRRASHIERLLVLAEQDPPADAEWPRLRILARVSVLTAAMADGSSLTQVQALAELEVLAAADEDPAIKKLMDIARSVLSFGVAFAEGDVSLPHRLKADAEAFRAVLPGGRCPRASRPWPPSCCTRNSPTAAAHRPKRSERCADGFASPIPLCCRRCWPPGCRQRPPRPTRMGVP